MLVRGSLTPQCNQNGEVGEVGYFRTKLIERVRVRAKIRVKARVRGRVQFFNHDYLRI